MDYNFGQLGCDGVIYDGVNLSDVLEIADIAMPLFPKLENVTQALAGKPGEYFSLRKIGTRTIVITAKLSTNSIDPIDIFNEWHRISEILNKPSPRKLELGDKHVYAILDGTTDMTSEGYKGIVELTFVCFDPYLYGRSYSYDISPAQKAEFKVSGAASAPILHLTATSSSVRVRNERTGDYVYFDELKANDAIIVDMEKQVTTVGGSYKPVYLASDYFTIEGDASVSVQGATGSLSYVERWI